MLISDFSNEFLNLGTTQFVISIALSQLGENEASSAVVAFYGLNVDSVLKKYGDINVIQQMRNDLEKKLLSGKQNMIEGLLNYLCTNGCLHQVRVGTHIRDVQFVTLTQMLKNPGSIQKVYEKSMQIIRKCSLRTLLALYIDTEEYKKFFEMDINRYYHLSADGTRRNDLSHGIMEELRADFKKFIFNNSCNGTYLPDSGTPSAFLRNAFAFYRKGDSIRNLLNTKGTNLDIGGDSDMTFADYKTLNDKHEEQTIDFIDIANRINRASHLLFSHNNSEVAFFDILSCYRDSKIQEQMQDVKSKFTSILNGCYVSFTDSANIVNCGNKETIENKKKSRIQLCRKFSRIVDEGLSQNEVYQYYRDALALTDETIHHDGRRLFTYIDPETGAAGVTNHTENNSQMLQIIVSGHLALRELVLYLNSRNSDITIYNFPTIIFRNRDYLYRFQSLDEYVTYIYDVAPLVENVKDDPERSRTVIDGIYINNDTIWKMLGMNDLLQDNLFTKLTSMPLSFIRKTVDDSQALSKDKIFENKFADLMRDFSTLIETKNKFVYGDKLPQKYNAISQFYATLASKDFSDRSAIYRYAVYFAFYDCLLSVLRTEGHAPYSDEYYLYEKDNAKLEFENYSPQIASLIGKSESYKQLFAKQATLRAWCVSKIYHDLIGNAHATICNWEQLREYFCIMELLKGLVVRLYTNGIQKVKKEVHPGEDFSYLLVARMAEDTRLSSIPQHLVSCDELSFVYTDEKVPEMYVANVKDIEESIQYNQERNKAILSGANNFLAIFGDAYETFSLAEQLIEKYVSKKYAVVSGDAVLDNLLQKASEEAHTYVGFQKINQKAMALIQGVASLDDCGYVLRDGKRLTLRNQDTFVLGIGLLVIVSPERTAYNYSIMTDDDIRVLNYCFSYKKRY